MSNKKGKLIVISAPSGAGKSSLIKAIISNNSNIELSISATTRMPREGEGNAKDYFFISDKEFNELKLKDEFVECALVHNYQYGTLKSYINERIDIGINVILDIVPYDAIMNTLPIQLAAGEGPDIARVTDLGGLNKYYADITSHVANPQYYEDSFGPFLKWYRKAGDTSSIHGFHSTMTVTGPYVNKTLFEQAGVDLLGPGATWAEWANAANAVASKLDIPIPMAWDRSVHRVSGPAVSMGAQYFDANGDPKLVDDGLKAMTQMLYDWHQNGTMSKDLWGSVSGTKYHAPNDWWNI